MLSTPSTPQIAIGEVLWDMLPSGPRLGGTTTNFAVLSARLGEYAAPVSYVGDDALGREAVDCLSLLTPAPRKVSWWPLRSDRTAVY